MAKTEEVTTSGLDIDIIEDNLTNRDVYPTAFRNIDTNIAQRVYDDEDKFIQINRGMRSGSWVTFVGVSHSGKSTLCAQILSSITRQFVNETKPDPNVFIYIVDVENGLLPDRFKHLTGFSDTQIKRHVRWVNDCTLEGLQDLLTAEIKRKSAWKEKDLPKRIDASGQLSHMYPPTFIMIDAVSELISRDVVDVDGEATNTLYMNQNRILDTIVKKYKLLFVKYNINVLAVAHIAKKIDVSGNPMARPTKDWKGLPSGIKINGGQALQYATDLGIFISKIEAVDDKAIERKGGRSLDAQFIMSANIFKNRQGFDNIDFFLVFNKKGMFDQLASFIYECQQNKVLTAAGAIRKIDGTEHKVQSHMLREKILTDEEFRKALFDKYDESKEDQLESLHLSKEERQRHNDVLDILVS